MAVSMLGIKINYKFTHKGKMEKKVRTKESSGKSAEMGFVNHPFTSPNTVVPRKSRWTLAHADYPIHWWIKSIKADYVNKEMHIEAYDDAKGDVFTWTQALLLHPKEHGPLTLSHLDGSGQTISSLKFLDLKLGTHHTEYAYGVNDVLQHKITISYGKVERHNEVLEK